MANKLTPIKKRFYINPKSIIIDRIMAQIGTTFGTSTFGEWLEIEIYHHLVNFKKPVKMMLRDENKYDPNNEDYDELPVLGRLTFHKSTKRKGMLYVVIWK